MCHTRWIAIFSLCFAFASADRTVKTTTGNVRGVTLQTPDGKEVEAFLGIPYAEPPIGKLRFERPLPIRPWEGEYNATFLPPPCYQNYTFKYYWTPDVERMTEDCLYLNIWVPGSIQDTKLKAIFMWIYGGAFNIGSTEMDAYNGAILASRGDMIVASVNYRVGMFGFMTTPVQEAAGNMGMYDQILAFRWIRANAEFFGGDPELITVAGESAGAMSAALFLLSPMTRGMVKRAILQSGGLVHPMSPNLKNTMIKIAEKVAQITGCSDKDVNLSNSPKMVVDCLKHLPPNAISEAEGLVMKVFPITASPHTGDDLLPHNPTDLLMDGDFQETEVLLGCTKDEGSNFLVFVVPEYFGIYGAGAPILKKRLSGYLIRTMFGSTEQRNNTADIAKFYVEGNGNRKLRNEVDSDDDEETDYMKTAVYDSIGDYMILCPTVFHADFLSVRKKPVYFYMFTHRPSTTVNAKWMGVTHFDEVPFVFGRPLSGDKNYTEDDKKISRRMMDRWIAFTKTGNPNIEDEIEWPPYKWNEPLYMDINVEEKIKIKPDDYRCEFWRDRYQSTLDHFRSDGLTAQAPSGAITIKDTFAVVMICLVLLAEARS